MKKITIELPDDCEVKIIKKENNIKEKLEEPIIKTYQDLIDNKIQIKGYFIDDISRILETVRLNAFNHHKNIAFSKKVAKSMLAMAMISQLMPYYGGEITNEEWRNDSVKHIISRSYSSQIYLDTSIENYYFLAFHTEDQRDEFITNNEELIKDYFMID